MSRVVVRVKRRKEGRVPGVGFLRNFFKVHGPSATLKGMYYSYYSRIKMRNLSLDPNKDNVVNVNGYNMLVIPTDKGISSELAMFNIHEPLSTTVLKSQLKKGMVCLDIGSNIGYYALLESSLVGEEGRVICIEPSPLNYQYLKKNLQLAGESQTEAYNIAVGDIDGHASFFADAQSNLCRVITNEANVSVDARSEVPMRRVDSLVNDLSLDKLDFVRMDPEGYEPNIYDGMKSTIRKFRPMLFIEFHKIFMGAKVTKKLLLDLRDTEGYDSLYYIQRWMDQPKISSSKYIQEMKIEEVIRKLDRGCLPEVFSLLLAKSQNQ